MLEGVDSVGVWLPQVAVLAFSEAMTAHVDGRAEPGVITVEPAQGRALGGGE
jgi:hypothetical protein